MVLPLCANYKNVYGSSWGSTPSAPATPNHHEQNDMAVPEVCAASSLSSDLLE